MTNTEQKWLREIRDNTKQLERIAKRLDTIHRQLDRLDRKDESQSKSQYDFGEYADRLWKIAYERGKREALEQTEPSCDTCKLKDTTEWCKRQEVCRAYQPKDEPQTDCAWK